MIMGKTIDRVKKLFGYEIVNIGGRQQVSSNVPRAVAGKRITIKLVEFLQQLSNFSEMQDEEIQEQLFVWDPEIGGALDRLSTLVAQSYKGPFLRDTDKATDALEKQMVLKAAELSDDMRAADLFEMYSELLALFGDLYLDVRDPMMYKTLPNKFVTFVEEPKQIGNIQGNILLTQGNYLVFNERMISGMFYLKPGEFKHLKYKDTPIFCTDKFGRWTYGIYSVSPVQRAIISTWQSRITSIIDTLYRFRIIPREVHSIDSTLFSLDQFNGQLDQMGRLSSSQTEANKYIDAYNIAIQNQTPDQGYTVLDTVTITLLEAKSAGYMKTNELIDQLDNKKWVAMNMPKSVVTGEGAGSYASELVISNYVSQKAIQLANKIKPLVLANMRTRLSAINSSFPVDKLDLKIELSMAASELETFRQMAIMGSLGCFTQSEIRALAGYQPLKPEDKVDVVMGNTKTLGDHVRDMDQMASGGQNPQTPQSDQQHSRDVGQNAVRNSEQH